MKIIQLTDLHIGHEGQDTHGVDVRNNFLRLLGLLSDSNPDHLVISGDLCYRDGDRSIYVWIKEKISTLGIPYSVISGNHDDPTLIAEVFALQNELKAGSLYYQRQIGWINAIFLDTTTGTISSTQLSWLKNILSQSRESAFLFMHHPPFPSGVPFMDNNHLLRNRDEVAQVLLSHSAPVYVFSGHYHVDKVIATKNVISYITPSCFMQIDQQSATFKVDHYQVGYRVIDVEGPFVQSRVQYLP